MNFGQTRFFPPPFFFSTVNSAASQPMHRTLGIVSYLNLSHLQRALHAPAAPIHRWDIVGSMGTFTKRPHSCLFSSRVVPLHQHHWDGHKPCCRKAYDAGRGGFSVSLGPAAAVAQHYSPALIKQRGTAGCVCLGHHSLPWTQRTEKAEASQC